ncbi:prepilin-type N-terminal cleavage/methylation domain-containing protein [Planococcus salinus]|uniref:Prepilin-type N-terminal cleavage/methylation domain-containing protein n=1 Tax=Planococcus salinus TaxID=1848460 RepID=A0A3M8PBC7_9BACL|nr:prepilin-type N-terminal cleavage/methylation domain-containing protein [Planococcus salinus]RNF40933.1 prepilin-type N-terminal cleavage/methylation domain-containing protein [Planococcus salinus]
MKKFIQKKLKDQKGMTLIELLAVIVIIAIIAAIAIPAIGNIITNSRIDAVKSDALNVLNAASLYEAQEGDIAAAEGGLTVEELEGAGFLDDAGSIPDDGDVVTGPGLSTTVTVGDDITIEFNNATIQEVNAAISSSEIRQNGGATIGDGAGTEAGTETGTET